MLALEQAGVRTVFGMPGGKTGGIFIALGSGHTSIRTILVRHESLASVMAEVSGRLTGLPGVVMGQGAFLLANGALGALEGHLGSSPMVLIADLSDGAPYSYHGPYQAGTGDYGAWDAKRAFEGFTKRVFVAFDGPQAVQGIQLALKHAMSGEPGPVAVLLHSSALAGNVGPESRPRLYTTSSYVARTRIVANEEDVRGAAQMLSKADRPVVVAGNGVRVSNAYKELQSFAESIGTPVATTAAGKGVFPEVHPLALGTIGNFGLDAAHHVVGEADVILAVGTKLGPTDTANENAALIDPTRQTLIQVDVEPLNVSWTYPASLSLVGDAATVLNQLLDASTEFQHQPALGVKRVELAHKQYRTFDVPESTAEDSPLLPQRLIRELEAAIPADGIVTCDAGENRIFMSHYFRTKSAGSYLQPASIGGMGYAIPAALGAQVTFPERPCIAFCGDGGFAMSMSGLLTAIEEDLPITVVVMNNSALGWVLHGQGVKGHRPAASQFGDFNYAAVAQAIGCESFRVSAPAELGPALRQAISSGRPSVVDVATSLKESFTKVTSSLVGGRG